jgi:hypothetical protein
MKVGIEGCQWEVPAAGYGFSLGDNKNVLKQIMAMVIQFYEYTKNN